MAFWIYILRCADGSYYTGHTDDFERRVGEHRMGAASSCYTFRRRPLDVVFTEEMPTREEALAAERQIKGWSRKKKEAMIRGDWDEVSRLARSKSQTARPESMMAFGRNQRSNIVSEQQPVEGGPTPVRAELVEAWTGSAGWPVSAGFSGEAERC